MSDNNNININTPDIGPYTHLQPFRFWCQKVLPLVYDESLSYYELLCKVVDYLNKTMEDVDQMITDMGEFQTAYTEFTTETRDAYIAFSREVSQAVEGLETFVNNYFNNLNVQQEINNKLDAMAAAGYFDTLFTTLFTSDIINEAGNVTSAWIAANLSQETGYVIDKSLTVNNAAADAKVTGFLTRPQLENATKERLSLSFMEFVRGGYYQGNYTANIKYRITTSSDITVNGYTIINCDPAFKMGIFTGENQPYEELSGWVNTWELVPGTTYHISVRRATEDATEELNNTEEFSNALTITPTAIINQRFNTENIQKIYNGYVTPSWWNWARGGVVSGNYFSAIATYRVGTPDYITLDEATILYVDTGFLATVVYNDGDESGWFSGSYTIVANKPFRVTIKKDPEDTSFVITDITAIIKHCYISVKGKAATNENNIIENNADVPLFIKQALRPINLTDNQYLTEPKPLVLFHFSDIHASKNALTRLIAFYKKYESLFDDAICTGDLKAAYSDNSLSFWNEVPGAENVLIAIGNHDVTNRDNTLQTEAEQYTAMFAPYIENWDVTYTNGLTYYYKDYAASEVRLIVLNNMLSDAENTDQLSWFNTTLTGAKTLGYTVIVADHFPNGWGDNSALACNFTNVDATLYSAQFLRGAYQTAIRDFVTGGGKFACYIGGHTHRDVMKTNPDISNQIGVIIDAANVSQSLPFSDMNRNENDKSADLANIVVIDTSSKTLKVIRLGSNVNRYLVSRKTISLNYENLNIITEG